MSKSLGQDLNPQTLLYEPCFIRNLLFFGAQKIVLPARLKKLGVYIRLSYIYAVYCKFNYKGFLILNLYSKDFM